MTKHVIPLFKSHIAESAIVAVRGVLKSGQLAEGERLREFTCLLRDFVQNPNGIVVSNASAAIDLALRLCDVHAGDEVIVSPMCCASITTPIANLGAVPVWCDVHPDTGMIDAQQLEPLFTVRTRAILFTHWSGDVADIDQVNCIAQAHQVRTIDDGSDAFGATLAGNAVGNNGTDFTALSFSAVRTLTTGDGGALFARQTDDIERAARLKDFGIDRTSFRTSTGDINPLSDIPEAGYSYRSNDIAGAIGTEEFAYVEELLARHRRNAHFLDEALSDCDGIRRLRRRADSDASYWTYSLIAERRDQLQQKLAGCGIASQRLHVRNDLYSCFPQSPTKLRGVEAFDTGNLSIPCGWWVSAEDLEIIVSIIREGW